MQERHQIKQFFENELNLGKEEINTLGSELKEILQENSLIDDVA